MDIHTELTLLPRLVIATVMGGVLGYERERSGNSAGVRTYAAVSLGACVLTAINLHLQLADPTRMVASIISGIGFLGAGVIFRDTNQGYVKGLTTAATLWATAAVGISIGFGMYVISTASTLILFLLLYSHNFSFLQKIREKEKVIKKNENEI
ncbi:MAG: MgtC/SapB family protein [Bacteroidia bacterium]|nr:MgtC/SapB family protein [Bacteroidia bacterium]